ncbi:5-methylcytosine restriction system specificity protein McrC [Photobacterium toruni]|uniref:McrBC 5-methylcytosine restriction system component n=1 Tax=Photobacterium toruni TaxID=1935446 RepID=A0A1T4T6A8_9GAMM|nr:hypothetical protein [Photobacterium toruni]SKA36014.1 McrBC 5-methylcytosine restriction system component [Photobacterium toruni]
MSTQVIFISESDSLEDVYQANPAFDGGFPRELAFLFNKKNNNYVGYALFEHGDKFFKVFVLPKIIDNGLSEEQKIRFFVSYLAKVHELDQSDLKKAKQLPLELAYLKTDAEYSAQKEDVDIDDFRVVKYSQLLNDIELFFRNCKATATHTINYASQSIQHKLDLRKNITALDKSRIHQNKKKTIPYSELAKVAYAAVRLFLQYKEELLSKPKHLKLRQQASSLSVFLAKKFNVPRGYSLHLQALAGTSIFKLFTKNPANRNVYLSILTLFGLERFWDEDRADIRLDMYGEYFFFRPEKVFELLVHEYLSTEYGVKQDQIKPQIQQSYPTYVTGYDRGFSNKSIPDHMFSTDECSVLVDAKWKILDLSKDKKSPFDALDLLKLERDSRVRRNDKDKVEHLLAYPVVKGVTPPIYVKTEYNKTDIFNFKVIQVPFDL